MTYESQSARDAQRTGYGNERYWSYLDQAALDARDYWLRHGDPVRAEEQMTMSLGQALARPNGYVEL